MGLFPEYPTWGQNDVAFARAHGLFCRGALFGGRILDPKMSVFWGVRKRPFFCELWRFSGFWKRGVFERFWGSFWTPVFGGFWGFLVVFGGFLSSDFGGVFGSIQWLWIRLGFIGFEVDDR